MPNVSGLYAMRPLYSSSITIDHTQVPSTQTDFPVLVSLVDNRFRTVANGGHVQNSSGFDIRPAFDAKKTLLLNYELERYNASTGEVIMWVRLPNICPTASNVFYLTYGDSTISSDGSNGGNVFCNAFQWVYHFKDGTTLSYTNSVNGAAGTPSATPPTAAAGQIDGGAAFVSASSEKVATDAQNNTASLTMSAWVNATSFPNAYNGVFGYNIGPNTSYALIMVKSTGKLAMYTNVANYDGTGTNTLSASTWYYLVLTWDAAHGLIGYVNGSSDGTAGTGGNLAVNSVSLTIGDDAGNAGRFWNGTLDEVRYAGVVRSPDWITCEYNNQKPSSTFITLGAETGP